MPARLRADILAPHDPSGSFLTASVTMLTPTPKRAWPRGSGSVRLVCLPANSAVPCRAVGVPLRRAVELLKVFPRQIPDHTTRNPRIKHGRRHRDPGQHDSAGGDERLGADP